MMQNLIERYGSWGLVAGAAEGLGSAYARALAAENINLILIDQQKDLLDELARQLKSLFGIQLYSLHLDLAEGDSVGQIMKTVRKTGCRFMIYNAAYSKVQKFMLNDPNMLERYVQVNIHTPMKLVHAFCHLHIEEADRRKGIVLMSSLAGSWGTQLLAPYGASKAFIHNLAESLCYELKDEGFDVLACIAGPTSTPGYWDSLPQGKEKAISVMQPDKVVRAALRTLGHRAFVIPGFRNKLNYFLLARLIPRRVSLKMMNRAVGNLYRNIL